MGRGSALFGIPFLVFGVAAVAIVVARTRIAPPGSATRTNAWMPIAFAAVFVAMGIAFTWAGLAGTAGRRRRARAAAEHGGEPWWADYDWDPQGQRQRPRVDVVGRAVGVIVLCLLVAPLDYWVFAIGTSPVITGVIVVTNLLVLWWVAVIVRRGLQLFRHGGITIRYGRFPFFLGDRLDVRVATAKRLPPGVPLTARLRFVREWIGTRGGDLAYEYFQAYGDETTVATDGLGEVSVGFPLPEGNQVTDMTASSRRFWELQLEGAVEGAAFDERFVVPVYRRSA